mmetsp:Transcript_2083/g.5298  ORF Transcript_2083/g.5298 Transcript_2083/m.5298 type:complete len:217 (+) Transcript_2083:1590-2240(+)
MHHHSGILFCRDLLCTSKAACTPRVHIPSQYGHAQPPPLSQALEHLDGGPALLLVHISIPAVQQVIQQVHGAKSIENSRVKSGLSDHRHTAEAVQPNFVEAACHGNGCGHLRVDEGHGRRDDQVLHACRQCHHALLDHLPGICGHDLLLRPLRPHVWQQQGMLGAQAGQLAPSTGAEKPIFSCSLRCGVQLEQGVELAGCFVAALEHRSVCQTLVV